MLSTASTVSADSLYGERVVAAPAEDVFGGTPLAVQGVGGDDGVIDLEGSSRSGRRGISLVSHPPLPARAPHPHRDLPRPAGA